MRRSTAKSSSMGQCKKHPRHRQSPGVCSLCLAEKLTRVSTTSSSNYRDRYTSSRARSYDYCSSSSASSSEAESSYPSSSASPNNEEVVGHRRVLSDVNMNNQFLGSTVSSSNYQLPILREEKKKVTRFWAKLIHPRKNDQKRLNSADLNDDNAADHHLEKNVLMLSPQ